MSRRQTARLLCELLGVRMSLGSVSVIEQRVSEAVEPAVDEAQPAMAGHKRRREGHIGSRTIWFGGGPYWFSSSQELTQRSSSRQ